MPHVTIFWGRVEFVGKNKQNNISILLWNITFEDGGHYTCFGRNPKEKGKNHSATFELIVVDECEWSNSLSFFNVQRSVKTLKPLSGEVDQPATLQCSAGKPFKPQFILDLSRLSTPSMAQALSNGTLLCHKNIKTGSAQVT